MSLWMLGAPGQKAGWAAYNDAQQLLFDRVSRRLPAPNPQSIIRHVLIPGHIAEFTEADTFLPLQAFSSRISNSAYDGLEIFSALADWLNQPWRNYKAEFLTCLGNTPPHHRLRDAAVCVTFLRLTWRELQFLDLEMRPG